MLWLMLLPAIIIGITAADAASVDNSRETVQFIEFRSDTAKRVSIAGDFNDWSGSASGKFDPEMTPMIKRSENLWVYPLTEFAPGTHQYKFIVDGQWEAGQNRILHLNENHELIDPTGGVDSVTLESPSLIIVKFKLGVSLPASDKLAFKLKPHGKIIRVRKTAEEPCTIQLGISSELLRSPLAIPLLEIEGLASYTVMRPVLIDPIFKKAFISDKTLGAFFDRKASETIFRVFAPRATEVFVHLFRDRDMTQKLYEVKGYKDKAGVWEMRISGKWPGYFYAFSIDGPSGEFEGFKPWNLWPDPYSKASVNHLGPSVLLDHDAESDATSNVKSRKFKSPRKNDLIIWEVSVRDVTSHESSNVPPGLRGKYLGLSAAGKTGSGIDHMKDLGINAVELLPVFEFDNDSSGSYDWGYMPGLFFAPETSYAVDCLGGQKAEFKAMVDALHEEGIAVILDVVFTHTGSPRVLTGSDRAYFFRYDGNMIPTNFSGCGNDFNTENPMARRMILDCLEYWLAEFNLDGFRFVQADLIDPETLHIIEKRLNCLKPDILLVAEPSTSNASLQEKLEGTSWASWNLSFGTTVKEVAAGRLPVDELLPFLRGFTHPWAQSPQESVNFVECHDGLTLNDYFSVGSYNNPDTKAIRRNLFCAAATLLSPGIPMIAGGQEMLRTKKGNADSYNAGDAINTLDYGLKNIFPEVYSFYKGLISFRKSSEAAILRIADRTRRFEALAITANISDAAGLLWNDLEKRTNAVLILLNANESVPAEFRPKLPAGKWIRCIGDCKVFVDDHPDIRCIFVPPEAGGIDPVIVAPLTVDVWIPAK